MRPSARVSGQMMNIFAVWSHGRLQRATVLTMSRGTGTKPGPLALAVAAEIRAELGRRNMSQRSLDAVLTSHGYVQARLGSNASQSLDFTDVEALCDLLGIEPLVLFQRAKAALKESGPQGSQE
jgi:hypothetical protein